MEELVQLIIVLAFIGFSTMGSISKAKAKRKQELEEFVEAEEDPFGSEDSPVPPPPPRPQPTSSKGTTWDDLRKQLERAMREPGDGGGQSAGPSQPIPSPVEAPRPVAAKPLPIPVQYTEKKSTPKPKPKPKPQSRPKVQPQRRLRTTAARPAQQPAMAQRRRPGKKGPLVFHSNPLANAIIASEVLSPRHPRGPRRGPEAFGSR